MKVVRVGPLPDGALEAAAEFHGGIAREIARELGLEIPPRPGEDLVLIFPPAPYDHRGWRVAAIEDLARAAAPRRVNAIDGDDDEAIAQARAYLEAAPGITGQLLAVEPR